MDELLIEASEFTPGIHFKLNGEFYIGGVSRPEDVNKFFLHPYEWLNNFKTKILSHPENKYKLDKVHFVFKMKYFNSASAKHILRMLDKIREYELFGIKIDVDWHYDEADEQLLEDGQDLAEALDLPFNYIKMM